MPDAERLDERVRTYNSLFQPLDGITAILAVRDLGIFQHLLGGPLELEALAGRTSTVGRRLRSCLDVVVSLGFLRRDGDRYGLCEADEALFDPRSPGSRRLLPAGLEEVFRKPVNALDILRGGEALSAAGSGGDVGPARRRDFLLYLDANSRSAAERVAFLLSPYPVERFADLGCGAGTFAFALLRGRPGSRGILVDRPDAGETVTELARESGVEQRVDFVPGDLLSGDFLSGDFLSGDCEDGLDLVLLSNVLHCYGPEENLTLLRRVRRLLRPGGRVAVKEWGLAEDRSGPAASLGFSFSLTLCSEAGDVYSEGEIRGWLEQAELPVERSWPLAGGSDTLILARRP